MTAGTDLAGVIGTWVAVLLALVALLGVVAPVLIIRRQRSDRYRALRNVYDDHHKFLTGDFPGLRSLFLSVKVPDLSKPPELGQKRITETKKEKENLYIPSRTGWISLSSVLQAYDLEPKQLGDVEIAYRQTWRPVNRLWLLAVGLLGRYGDRKDKGRAKDIVNEDRFDFRELVDLKNTDSNTIFGNTGILQYCPGPPDESSPSEDGIAAYGKVYFTMYNRQIHGKFDPDELPLKTLFWLSIGCLPLADGTVYDLSKRNPLTYYSSTNDQQLTSYRYRFEEITDINEASRNVIWAKALANKVLPEIHGISTDFEKGERISWKIPSSRGDRDVSLRRSDVQRMARAILTIDLSPQGFLFDHNGAEIGHIILSNAWEKFETLQKKVLEFAKKQNSRISAISTVLQRINKPPKEFSRSLVRDLFSLDCELHTYMKAYMKESTGRDVTAFVAPKDTGRKTEPPWDLQSVGILFITDINFQKDVEFLQEDEKPVLEIEPRKGETKGCIRFSTPSPNKVPKEGYILDGEVFSGGISPLKNVSLTYKSVLLAALRASTRSYAFHVSIDSSPLLSLIDKMDDIVYVSASTIPRRANIIENSNFSRPSSPGGDRSQERATASQRGSITGHVARSI